MQSQSTTFPNGNMNNTNGQSLPSSKPLSPVHNNQKFGNKSSTIDNASLDELDRIMDTLSTLSRSTSIGRNKQKENFAECLSARSNGTSNGVLSISPTSPLSATSPTSSTNSPYLPPRMTSPSITPMLQSPTKYASTNLDRKSLNSNNKSSHENPQTQAHFGGNNRTSRSRFPSEYENTNIKPKLYNSPQDTRGKYTSSPYEHIVPDVSPNRIVNNHSDGNSSNRYFYGPLPMSPRAVKRESDVNVPHNTNSVVPQQLNRQTNQEMPRKMSYQSLANMGQDPYGTARAEFGSSRGAIPGFPRSSVDEGQRSNRFNKRDYNTIDRGYDNENPIPKYNDKKSYLSNLENGTLPRSKLDVQRQHQLEGKKNERNNEVGADMYNINNSLSKRKRIRSRLRTKPSASRQSRSSFTSYSDNGRCYASVSTAPAAPHSLIQPDIFRTNQNQTESDIVGKPTELSKDKKCCGSENFCVKSGRYLYTHLLEMFILASFCASIPIGIILQALNFHSTPAFNKYISFFGREMTLNLLSTLTPITVFMSILCATATLPLKTLKRISLFTTIFYTLSLTVAALLSSVMILAVKPGVSNVTNGFSSNISQANYIDTYYFTTNLYEPSTASDEILMFLRLLLPGCGNQTNSMTNGICNLFVLVILAFAFGAGVAASGPGGSYLRKILMKLGTAVTKMNNIFCWYLPFGVLLIMSEFMATKIDWADIGHDGQTMNTFINNVSVANIFPYNDIDLFHQHLKWNMFCVLMCLVIYGFLLLPLLVAIITRSNPLSLLGCRSLATLFVSSATGFSDVCIPLTGRCLYKQKKRTKENSICCIPVGEGVDERLGHYSAVMGGIFNRGGSLILLICSSMFYAQVTGVNLSIGTVLFICVSAIVVSIVTISGKWFYGRNPYFQSMVIILNSAGAATPLFYPRLLFCQWIVCRFAALVDTLSDLLITYLVNHICRKQLDKVIDVEDRRCSEAFSQADTKLTALPTPKLDDKILHKPNDGNNSDYDDAPLLFNTYYDGNGSNESTTDDGKEQHNEVFYPSTSSTTDHRVNVKTNTNNNQNSNNNTPSRFTVKDPNGNVMTPVAQTRYKANLEHSGRANLIQANSEREETAFVTF